MDPFTARNAVGLAALLFHLPQKAPPERSERGFLLPHYHKQEHGTIAAECGASNGASQRIMSLETILLFVWFAALFVAAVTEPHMGAKERHAVHVRAIALVCAIVVGSLFAAVISAILLRGDLVAHARWEARGYHWLIGMLGGGLIYCLMIHIDKRTRQRIANGEILSLGTMVAYAWVFEEQRKQAELEALRSSSPTSRIEELLGRPDDPLVKIEESDGTTTRVWDSDTKSWRPSEPK